MAQFRVSQKIRRPVQVTRELNPRMVVPMYLRKTLNTIPMTRLTPISLDLLLTGV